MAGNTNTEQDAALAIAFEGLAIHAGGRLLALNGPFAALFGQEADALVGRGLAELFAVQGRDVAHGLLASGHGMFCAVACHHSGLDVTVEVRQRPVQRDGRSATLLSLRPIGEHDRLLTNFSGAVLTLSTPEGALTYVSPAVSAVLGYAPEALIGRSVWELMHPEDRAAAQAARAEALGTPEDPTTMTYRALRQDGGYRWLESRTRHLPCGPGGTGPALLSETLDVTARVEAEQTLSQVRDRLAFVVNQLPVVLFALDPQGILTLSEGRALQNVGVRPGELVGRSLLDLYAHDETVQREVRRALSGEAFAAVSGWVDGWKWETTYTPIFDDDGRLASVIGLAHDITERKRAELEFVTLSRQRELILDSAGEGIYGLDQDGHITFVNPVAAHHFGYEPHELVGRHVRSDPSPAVASMAYPLDNGLIGRQEEVLWRQDGSSFFARCNVMPILESGVTVGAVVTFSDVTEPMRAEAALKLTNAELQRLSHLKDDFLSTVSHELRTPLAAIKNAAVILTKQMAGPLNETQARFVGMVSDHVRRLNRLVDEILDLQKLEAGSMDLHQEVMDLRPLVLETVNGYSTVFGAKGLQVTVDLPSEPLMSRIDRDRLSQVLLNLCSNAAKFTLEGGCVEVGGRLAGDDVHLWVRDDGLGVAPGDLARMFEKFVQLDGGLTRSVGGTGLGLAICKQLVDGHGGRIWAESEASGGTTIHVTLPGACLNPDPLLV